MAKFNAPLVGPWKRKISRIDKLELVDCVPNSFAVVAGAAVAGFHLFWALNAPECVDQAWDRLTKGGRHRRFIANGFTTGPASGPPKGVIGTHIIPLGNIAQRAGWFMGVIDGVLDGVYYGTSLILRYSGCANPTMNHAQLSITNGVPALLPAAEFVITTWFVESVRGISAGPAGVAFFSNKADSYTVVLNINQGFNQFPPLQDCSFTCRIRDGVTGRIFEPSWTPYANLSGPNMTFYSQDIDLDRGAHNLQVICTKTFGVLFFTSAMFTVTVGPYSKKFAAWDCGAKIPVIGSG